MRLRKRDEKGQVLLVLVIVLLVLLFFAVFGGIYLSPWVWLILILIVVIAFLSRGSWYHRGGPPVV